MNSTARFPQLRRDQFRALAFYADTEIPCSFLLLEQPNWRHRRGLSTPGPRFAVLPVAGEFRCWLDRTKNNMTLLTAIEFGISPLRVGSWQVRLVGGEARELIRRIARGLIVFGSLWTSQVAVANSYTLPEKLMSRAADSEGVLLVSVSPPQRSMLWLVVSSRPTYNEALVVAEGFSYTAGPSLIIQTQNGNYAVSLGTLFEDKAKPNLTRLKELRLIPDDAFLSAGSSFSQIVWHSFGSNASTDLMTQPALRQTVVRMQSALARMGFYNGEPDGLIGPGTVKSFSAYGAAFSPPSGDYLDSDALSVMEANARDGFNSQGERQLARSKGFEDAESFTAAKRAGFDTASSFREAHNKGFASRQEYDDARKGGFYSREEYQRARRAGFDTAYDYNSARALGIETRAEYAIYTSSGFSDAGDFRAARGNGFTDKATYDAARTGGFKTLDEFQRGKSAGFESAQDYRVAQSLRLESQADYVSFKSSGFNDVETYRTAKAKGFVEKAAFEKAVAKELREAQQNAKTVLADADTFLRLNPTISNLIEIAERAAALNATLTNGTTEVLNETSGKLDGMLAALPGYSDFAAKRKQERADALATQKIQVKADLQAFRNALTRWVSANISSPKLPEVVGELKLLGESLQSDDLETLTGAESTIEALIARQNLAGELEAVAEAPSAGQQTASATDDAPDNLPFATTPLNEFIMRGPLDDVVVLQNAGPDAPALVRNLAGDFSFIEGVATICTFGLEMTPSIQRGLRDSVKPMGASEIVIISRGCTGGNIRDADVLLIHRKAFLESETDFAVAVLDALEARTLRPFPQIDFAKLDRKRKDEDALSASIARGIIDGTRKGYGAVQFPVSQGAVCAVWSEQPEVHTDTLGQAAGFVGMEADLFSIKPVTQEEAYTEIQRNRCAMLYAPVQTLAQVTAAMERDGLPFSVLPLWFDEKLIAAAKAKLDADREEATKEAESQRLSDLAEAAAAERRQREANEQKSAREALMREKSGAAANALLNLFDGGLKSLVLGSEAGAPNGGETGTIEIPQSYPEFVQWHASMTAEKWVPTSVGTTVNDFGTVDWKGRKLEAIVVETRVKTTNRERGEYREDCFQLGAVIDKEFEMVRDPIQMKCGEDVEVLAAWKTGHTLTSGWIAN